MKQLVNILVDRGEELFSQSYMKIQFAGIEEADNLLNDLKIHPHAFVLACIMDRQIKAERAWLIPFEISYEIGGFEFGRLINLDLEELESIFYNKSLHRFNKTMAENFFNGIKRIYNVYNGDASNIWNNNPKSASVVRRFLQFKGIGIKIASMAANILARDFKINMSDRICLDISPDVHVRRVFSRLSFTDKDATTDEVIYCARELYPEYPGIFDLSAWEIGRKWCKPTNPLCEACYLDRFCPKQDSS